MDGVYPSLFAAPQLSLLHAMKQVDQFATGYHVDLIDLHFADNLALNFLALQEIQKNTRKPLFIHLMVDNPRHALKKITLRPNDMICFHIENNTEHHELIMELKQNGVIPFIAINPSTDPSQLSRALHADGILVMGVNPGLSGQPVKIDLPMRIREIVTFGQKHGREWMIGADGGVNKQNVKKLRESGAQIICAGSAIFGSNDYAKAIQELE